MKKITIALLSVFSISIIILSSVLIAINIRDRNKSDYPTYSEFSFDDPYINPVHPSDLTVYDWLEDLYYFMHMVKENYPFLWTRERTHGYNWLDLIPIYRDKVINCQSNAEFLMIISDLTYALQNIHSFLISDSYIYSLLANLYKDIIPYNYAINEHVDQAYSYWESYLNNLTIDKNQYYDVYIVYEKGNYTIYGENTTLESYGIVNGSIVISVNDIPIDEAIRNAYDKDLVKIDYFRDKLYLRYLKPFHFGTNATYTVKVVNSTEYLNISFSYGSSPNFQPPNFSRYSSNVYQLLDSKNAYIYIPTFSHLIYEQEYPNFIDFYEQIEGYDNLIIDIRGNKGGSIYYWLDGIIKPLQSKDLDFSFYIAYRNGTYINDYLDNYYSTATKISKQGLDFLPEEVQTDAFIDDIHVLEWDCRKPATNFNFLGNISIIVDDYTYSASEYFLCFCKETGFAKIYGTAGGGDGLLRSRQMFALPNSKLLILTSIDCGMTFEGVINEEFHTMPDVFYESYFNDWDELINYIS
ncbi:MAG: hypothetical protein FK733_03655 [Asgard group archaeon]|nr:hypothetical protein [Asgard group archaeon]